MPYVEITESVWIDPRQCVRDMPDEELLELMRERKLPGHDLAEHMAELAKSLHSRRDDPIAVDDIATEIERAAEDFRQVRDARKKAPPPWWSFVDPPAWFVRLAERSLR